MEFFFLTTTMQWCSVSDVRWSNRPQAWRSPCLGASYIPPWQIEDDNNRDLNSRRQYFEQYWPYLDNQWTKTS